MTVRELKVELELIAGIPLDLQRLQYLDQGDLMDDTTLKFHDVVPGGIISLCVWRYDGWIDLVLAAVEEDTSKLSCLGVTEDSPYQTAHVQHLGAQQWRMWTAQRAFVALYVASHRGHADAVRFLLEHGIALSAGEEKAVIKQTGFSARVELMKGSQQMITRASCHGQTPMGRTPLHAAVAMNQLDCINLLLQFGASAIAKDALGVSPKAIARKLNYKQAKQRMALSHWMAESGRKSPVDMKLNKALQRGKPRSGSKNKT
ncbi:ankyrin repeat domain-containing protein 60 [Molossus nigricans]